MPKKIDIELRPGETAEQLLKRLVPTANTRLRQLEKLSKQPEYENVLKWSYAGAVKDIERLQGKTTAPYRFSQAKPKVNKTNPKTGKPKTEAQIKAETERIAQARANAVQRFLESPTSTKTGIQETYQKRADTINEKYGTNLTWEEIGKFWQSETARKLLEEYDSDTIMKMVATIKNLADTDQIKKVSDRRYKLNDDKVLNTKIRDILAEYDLTEDSFLFGDENDPKVQAALKKLEKIRKQKK